MTDSDAVEKCPFCRYIMLRDPVAGNDTFLALFDRYPVSQGHVLLIPRRHAADLFNLSLQEQSDLFSLLREVRQILDGRFHPDGYNVGINIGEAAGQTVGHLHVHVIPRYGGDVPDPEGGVRSVIPERAKYRHLARGSCA